MLIHPDVHRRLRVRQNREASRNLIERFERIHRKGISIREKSNDLLKFSRIVREIAGATKR